MATKNKDTFKLICYFVTAGKQSGIPYGFGEFHWYCGDGIELASPQNVLVATVSWN